MLRHDRLFGLRTGLPRRVRLAGIFLGAIGFGIFGAIALVDSTPAWADTVTMRSGMQFIGDAIRTAGIVQPAGGAGNAAGQSTVAIDDSLRRTFVPYVHVTNSVPEKPPLEKFSLEKRVASSTKRIGSVGPVVRIEPWDELGNRVYTMAGGDGQLSVIQGITQVTPHYVKVEGLQVQVPFPYVWDMRVSTNTIDRKTLSGILYRSINMKDANDRLRIVRLYMQAERYEEAYEELASVLVDFPELGELKKQLAEIRQLSANRLIREIDMRLDAGQYRLTIDMLNNFPEEGVAQETLIKVKDRLDRLKEQQSQGDKCLQWLKQQLEALTDAGMKAKVEPICAEIAKELNFSSLDRMADFLRFADDAKISADRKVSLAISGWLLGNGAGLDNIAVTSSLVEVRDLVRQYLLSKNSPDRDAIFEKLQELEGSDPANVARIIAQMKPLLEVEQFPKFEEPGLLEMKVPGVGGESEITYYVQLPPEYDPYRKYPCVVTLGSSGVTALDQLRWWTGTLNPRLGIHMGQASRQGYITIAPQWTRENQSRYDYSAREHAACLVSLRDACKKFAIDTDRVFLSGHATGGDAVWDIGLAHPDLWAGIIPIVASSDKYIARYFTNGRQLPMYFVGGELDGNKIEANSTQWNKYMTLAKITEFDVTLVDYLGRGQEHFQEEIFRIFDWMNMHRRNFNVESFECHTLRSWDNFFWFVEIPDLPPSKMVAPNAWPPPANFQPLKIEGRILKNNGLTCTKLKGNPTVIWLSPDMVNFSQPITINGSRKTITPNLRTLLEDVRTRADRQHPFWAKVEQ